MEMTESYIKPIIEFFPLYPVESRRGSKWELFSDLNEDDSAHRYYQGVKSVLQMTSGIFIFYDSRGRALYAGKAVEQNLWKEMNNVFNRSRDEVQKVRLVSHPERSIAYRPVEEKIRHIRLKPLKLYELSAYVSAYKIAPKEMISMCEALLIRAFANDLLNVKMESL